MSTVGGAETRGGLAVFRRYASDPLLFLFVAALGAWSFFGSGALGSSILTWDAMSSWFEADVARTFDNMVDRSSPHYRNKVHPLFSLIGYGSVFLLRTVSGLDPATATRLLMAVIAAIWVSLLFLLLRVVGCPRTDAVLFTALGACSASALFWFVVPETYPFGSVTILLALLLAAAADRVGIHRDGPFVAAGALTLAFTVTNWMFGLLAAWTNRPPRRALVVQAKALGVVAALWCVQRVLFPSSGLFLDPREEVNYLLPDGVRGIARAFKVALFHSMVMPAPGIVDKFDRPDWPVLSVQGSAVGSASLLGRVAAVLWLLSLGAGVLALFRLRDLRSFRLVLGLGIAGQLALHAVYGDETFLYALHFGPLLVIVAALGSLAGSRRLARGLACLLIAAVSVNNLAVFQDTARFFRERPARAAGPPPLERR